MAIHRAIIFVSVLLSCGALITALTHRTDKDERAADPVADVAVASTPAPTIAPDQARSAAPEPAPAPALAPRESRRLTFTHASEALAAHRSTFRERCWTPSASGPDHVDLRFNLAFDPEGTLVGVGISDSRKAFRADVSACLRGLSVKLKIPAPGVAVQVQVPLVLP